MKFTQHYSGSTVCAPSRCALLTGKHIGHAVVRGNSEFMPEGQQPMPADTVTMAHVLQNAGYTTGPVWQVGPRRAGQRQRAAQHGVRSLLWLQLPAASTPLLSILSVER